MSERETVLELRDGTCRLQFRYTPMEDLEDGDQQAGTMILRVVRQTGPTQREDYCRLRLFLSDHGIYLRSWRPPEMSMVKADDGTHIFLGDVLKPAGGGDE